MAPGVTTHGTFAIAALVLAAGLGCGDDGSRPTTPAPRTPVATPPSIGPGPRYMPPSLGRRAARGLPISGMRCQPREPERYGAHLEVFASRRVVVVPAGIGIAPPRVRRGAYVTGGRCRYPATTVEPTGVIEVAIGSEISLGDFFAIWGQPLSRKRLVGFTAPRGERVLAFVGGRRWRGDPRAIPLRRHAQIVLEVGGYVRPHPTYRFAPGL